MSKQLTKAARSAIDGMLKSNAATEQRDLQWTVHMRIERNISVTVEAGTAEEARAKAEEWDIVGDEQPGDTINCCVTAVNRDQ